MTDNTLPKPGLEMFGIIKIGDKIRPILERQANGSDACATCSGFGTYGNPLCGVCIVCQECEGSGFKKPKQSWWRRWWKK